MTTDYLFKRRMAAEAASKRNRDEIAAVLYERGGPGVRTREDADNMADKITKGSPLVKKAAKEQLGMPTAPPTPEEDAELLARKKRCLAYAEENGVGWDEAEAAIDKEDRKKKANMPSDDDMDAADEGMLAKQYARNYGCPLSEAREIVRRVRRLANR